ncbi:transposase [Paenibacillus agricola]|uniref:Transposase n=1 Tax=Paenibacillus agricola TaxID=2716264 RepID=A0ABX0JB83_9BACL|nr:transposase [Paenibacillus agricola]NHN33674.1 transposase [Paenibacillus agricola]
MIRPIESFALPADNGVLTDKIVVLGTPKKRIENVLRLIYSVDYEGNPVATLTNRFDLDADEIGQIYRERWAIETFFKWMKKHVRIRNFYGTSERAVMNQVWMASIRWRLWRIIPIFICASIPQQRAASYRNCELPPCCVVLPLCSER